MNGPHVRRRRARRRGKALVLLGLLAVLLLVSSMAARTIQTPAGPEIPTLQELVVARNCYAVSGDNGDAHVYLEDWPQYQPYITGDVDDALLCGPVTLN